MSAGRRRLRAASRRCRRERRTRRRWWRSPAASWRRRSPPVRPTPTSWVRTVRSTAGATTASASSATARPPRARLRWKREMPSGQTVTSISAGGDFVLAVTPSGLVFSWGDNQQDQSAANETPLPGSCQCFTAPVGANQLPFAMTVKAVSAGYSHGDGAHGAGFADGQLLVDRAERPRSRHHVQPRPPRRPRACPWRSPSTRARPRCARSRAVSSPSPPPARAPLTPTRPATRTTRPRPRSHRR